MGQHRRWAYGATKFADLLFYILVDTIYGRKEIEECGKGSTGCTPEEGNEVVVERRMPIWEKFCMLLHVYDVVMLFPVTNIWLFTGYYGLPTFIPLWILAIWGLLWPISDFFYREMILSKIHDPTIVQCSFQNKTFFYKYIYWPLVVMCLIPISEVIFNTVVAIHSHTEMALIYDGIKYSRTMKSARRSSSESPPAEKEEKEWKECSD